MITELEKIQAEIDLLHKQLDAKQLELDNKYAERRACRGLNKSKPALGNIEKRFQEDMLDEMYYEEHEYNMTKGIY